MDKLTRDILTGLLQSQAELLQTQAKNLSIFRMERDSMAARVRAACEASVMIARQYDPGKRREALDALWLALDGPPQSTAEKAASELSRAAAQLDRENDILAKAVADLIAGLKALPLDGE